eukprot:COSAG02_NODE_52432_length_308_cov_0.444976_1_plen_30_part_10
MMEDMLICKMSQVNRSRMNAEQVSLSLHLS